MAVSDRSGLLRFVISISGRDAQQSLADWDGYQGSKDLVEVETTTLDSFLSVIGRQLSPAFVKCDVEGAEVSVLDGSRMLLASDSPPVVMFEINRKALRAQGRSPGELMSMLRGYRMYFTPLDSNESTLQSLENVDHLPELANVFAFPERGDYAMRVASAKEFLGSRSEKAGPAFV